MREASASPMSDHGSPRIAALEAVAGRIDRITDAVGRAVAWLTLATVLICFATVLLRYVFHIGQIWLQELYAWTHVAAITLGAGYVLMQGGFVRVDLLHARLSPKAKALVELLGTVFLMLPFLTMMAVSGWSFFFSSWLMNEASQWDGGMPAVWLLKGALLLFVVSVGLQGLAVVARALAVLMGARPAPPSSLSEAP